MVVLASFCVKLIEAHKNSRAPSGLRQFLATESPWKKTKNAYFTFKAIFSHKIFKVNESRYTVLLVISGFIKKIFLIEFVNIFFSQINQ